jgi:hypothetical protein
LDKGLKAALVPAAAAVGVLCGGDHQLICQYDACCSVYGDFLKGLYLVTQNIPQIDLILILILLYTRNLNLENEGLF